MIVVEVLSEDIDLLQVPQGKADIKLDKAIRLDKRLAEERDLSNTSILKIDYC